MCKTIDVWQTATGRRTFGKWFRRLAGLGLAMLPLSMVSALWFAFQVTAEELTNGVINGAFVMLFRVRDIQYGIRKTGRL